MVWRHPMPVLSGTETPYRVPSSIPTPLVYRGLPLDHVEDVILTSSAWKQVAPFLLPREEVQAGRPITPLHAGHVGLLCTAGLLNGVFGQGSDRHIARWKTVKSVTVFEVKEQAFKEVHKRVGLWPVIIGLMIGLVCDAAVSTVLRSTRAFPGSVDFL
jgi:hypothetical protein